MFSEAAGRSSRPVLVALRTVVCCAGLLGLAGISSAQDKPQVPEAPQAQELQNKLAQGWNTWNTRSVTSHVLLPEGFALNLAFKQHHWLDEGYLDEPLIGRGGEGAEIARPGLHAWNGSYTRLDLKWQGVDAILESGHAGQDLVVLITPKTLGEDPVKLVAAGAFLWNYPGTVVHQNEGLLAKTGRQEIPVFATADHVADPYVAAAGPYLALPFTETLGLSTGSRRSVEQIRQILDQRRTELETEAAAFGELAEAFLAIQAGVAWNTIYEPKGRRVVSTVGRLWNEEYGGYCLFGWDNFFLAYLTSLNNRELALGNVLEHLKGATEDGFIPNDNRGNGCKTWDRSQPPVGGIMVREVYRRYPERWFLEAAFDDLLAWNRWWPKARLNDGLLSFGSSPPAENRCREPSLGTMRTAGYESGMDDSPMYEGVPFQQDTHTMALQDVGLNSLYIADSQALAEMAGILGRADEEKELRQRAQTFSDRLETLWHEPTAFYLNRRTDTGELSHRLSPTLFYPLLTGAPSAQRAEQMLRRHFFNPEEFWGDFMLPSIARNDEAFPRQRYWKGAIWPPLNFLTYLSLRRYETDEARAALADKSLDMFLREWRRKGFVSENYSAITGTGDDDRLSSDRFHSWGALFGVMSFMEAGYLAGSENPLPEPQK